MTTHSATTAFATQLAQAYRQHHRIAVSPELTPQTEAQAFAVQQLIFQQLGLVAGGWKIGAKTLDGPINGSPLPKIGMATSGATLSRQHFPVLGLELEIAFVLQRDFAPQESPYAQAEVWANISQMCTTIEVVTTRLLDWQNAPALAKMADLQCHGALIVGEAVPYQADFDFAQPFAQLHFNGDPLYHAAGKNTAGEPRRLLTWLVNHCRTQGFTLKAGQVLTAGTYTGIDFPEGSGTVTGEIAGLPPVTFTIAP